MEIKADLKAIENNIKTTNLKHIAIIMDGNRRWARKNNLPAAAGHKKGVDALRNIVRTSSDIGLKYLTVYAFSTENWNRKKDEVSFLMELLANTIQNETQELNKMNVKLSFIGRIDDLSENLQKILHNSSEKTRNNTGLNLQIAINYGAKDEITNALKQICLKIKEDKLDIEEINQKTISDHLYTSGVPDPDLLIRTGGENRISNYLLWQIAYSEIYITKKFWPEFNQTELKKAILDFSNRTRRFGAD